LNNIPILKSQTLQKKSNQLETSITKEYDLCDFCLGRLFSKKYNSSSYKLLGKKIRKKYQIRRRKIRGNRVCYICKNTFNKIDSYLELLISKSSNYQFNTFVLGTIIKPSLSERDDLIKSKYKIRAVESIKTSITKEISKKFSRKTKSDLVNLDPDLTLTVNLKTQGCDLRTKPIYLYCRYTKKKRGLPQKEKITSEFFSKEHYISHKSISVESKISQFLYEKFFTNKIKINWIGGEDKSSLVLGKGRPIFVKIVNPLKRNIRFPKKVKLGEIVLSNLKIIKEYPNGSKPFKSSILLNIETKDQINSEYIKKIKNIKNKPINIFEKNGKTNKKFIYRINYKKIGLNSFIITMLVDGGFPIKRFVEGRDVSPNISGIIKNKSTCKQFDFKQIYLST